MKTLHIGSRVVVGALNAGIYKIGSRLFFPNLSERSYISSPQINVVRADIKLIPWASAADVFDTPPSFVFALFKNYDPKNNTQNLFSDSGKIVEYNFNTIDSTYGVITGRGDVYEKSINIPNHVLFSLRQSDKLYAAALISNDNSEALADSYVNFDITLWMED